MLYDLHKSGIKIFPDFIHPEDLTEEFLKEHGLKENDVFLACGIPYRVEDDLGFLIAEKIKSWDLTEWYAEGGRHENVSWHNTYAVYSKGSNIRLVPYRGKTYFARYNTGEILDVAEGEVGEYSSSPSTSGGWKSWSDGFDD